MSKPGEPAGTGSLPWRVRFGGQVYRLRDQASLKRLVEIGRVPVDAEVQPPGATSWRPVSSVLGGADPGATRVDPWSAWESLDDEPLSPAAGSAGDPGPDGDGTARDPAVGVRPVVPPPGGAPPVSPGPADAGGGDVLAMPEPPTPVLTLSVTPGADPSADDIDEEISPDDDEPIGLGDAPPVAPTRVPTRIRPPPAGSPPGGPAAPKARPPEQSNVIYFPGPRPGRRDTEGATALDPGRDPRPWPLRGPAEASLLDPLDPTVHEPPRRRLGGADDAPRTNWWRVAAVAVMGALILGTVRFYVAMNTGIDYGRPERQPAAPPGAEIYLEGDRGTEGVAGTADGAVADDPVSAAALRDPYKDMEIDLRGRMMPGLQPVESVEDLETALFMELTNIGLSQARVAVNVLATAGETEIPEVAEVRIQVRDNGSGLDRQIGAASLVVGKYMQSLDLTVPLFELGFEGITPGKIRKRRIDADQARQLYLARLRLRDFLAGLGR